MLLGAARPRLAKGAAYALIAVAVVLVYKGTKSLSIAMGEIGAFGFFLGLRWNAHGIPVLGWHPSPLAGRRSSRS